MDEQAVGMIRDSLARLESTCQRISDKIDTHIEKDEVYWQKMDKMDGALGVWKWIAGLGGGSGVLAALAQFFNKH